MRVLLLGAMAAAVLLSIACTTKPGGPGGVVAPVGPPRTAEACSGDDVLVNTCHGKGGNRTCVVTVGVVAGKPWIHPRKLYIPKESSGRKPAVIVWRFIESQDAYEFLAADGPKELKTSPHFEESGPTDDEDGAHQNKPRGKHYRIKYKNTGSNSHKYTIEFKHNGSQVSCDPHIVSEAG